MTKYTTDRTATALLTLALAALVFMPVPMARSHGPVDYSDLFEQVRPSVVSVNSVTVLENAGSPFPFFFFGVPHTPPEDGPGSPFRSSGAGSGVIITSDGYIVTNAHVILNDDGTIVDNIEIVMSDKSKLPAQVVGHDTYSDVALLKVDSPKQLPTARIGDSDQIKVGQAVLAIGHPLGLDYTLTSGIISSLNRSLIGGGGTERYVPFIQTDAAINPGNSGGPLLNTAGEVIGINSRIISGRASSSFIGYSLAIPINLAMQVQGKLRSEGKIERGMLGVTFGINGIDEDDAKVWGLDPDRGGVIVNSIIEDSGADKGGIMPGDIILEYDNIPITDPFVFPRSIANTAPGSEVPLLVFREGTELTITVTIGSIEEEGRLAQSSGGASKMPFGMVLDEVPPNQLRSINLDGGALLQGFDDQDGETEIPQEMYKLRRGDIIIGVIISGKLSKVNNPDELRKLLSGLTVDTIGFQLLRGNSRRPFFLTVNLSN